MQKDEYGLAETLESDKIHVAGLVIGDYCEDWSHWEGTQSLSQWMQEQGVPGLYGTYRACSVSRECLGYHFEFL